MTASGTLYARNLYGRKFYGFAPDGGVSPTYPTVHAIYFNNTAITLTWGLITNANAYKIQVSQTPDFSGTLLINSSGFSVHQFSFTDAGVNDSKRWWRWAYSLDGGTSYSRWSEVGSYWINTGGAENINLSINTWALINPSLVTDRFILQDFPLYSITQEHQYRVRERNRIGTLLSEYITLKTAIQLTYDSNTYCGKDSFIELRRMNEEIKTFFIGTFKSNALKTPAPNIWKVQFTTDPPLSMFAAGRQDLYTGQLDLMEV